MPLSEAELQLVETLFLNNCNVKTVLQVLPHAIQSTLYRQKKNFDTYGTIHRPETAKKRKLRKTSTPNTESGASSASHESPPLKLSDTDRTVELLFTQGCTVRTVQTWFPKLPKSTLYRMRTNFDAFGSVRKPETMWKKKGRPSAVTPEMKDWLVELVKNEKEMWQRDLAYELFVKFGVFVSSSTISRLLKEQRISKRGGAASDPQATEDQNLDPCLIYPNDQFSG